MFRKMGSGWSKYWWGKGQYPHRDNVIEDVCLRLYTGNTMGEYSDFKLPRSIELLKNEKFTKENKTIIYIHGFEETAEQESVKVVVSAYLKAEPETNIILVDWSNMAFGSYFLNAAPNVKKVASALAYEIKILVDGGLNFDELHLIGHSLGGQMVGFVGKDLQKLNIKLKRITSLDPAFPVFYPSFVGDHISGTDAEFVDIIHTDAGGYGAPVTTGSLDFWPNGGSSKQPGCPKFAPIPLSDDSLCSHWRSWRFWAESVLNNEAFPAVAAKSFKIFKQENTKPDPNKLVVYMGPTADKKATGNYYMITSPCIPFGKGMSGTYVEKSKNNF